MEIIQAVADQFKGMGVAEAVLLFIVLTTMVVAFRSQNRDDFDWKMLISDENGKISAARLMVVISGVSSSWVLIDLSMNVVKPDGESMNNLFNFYLAYMGIWSCAKPVEQALTILANKWGPKP